MKHHVGSGVRIHFV